MPDLDETLDEGTDAAPETGAGEDAPTPWGDDFNPERAWKTISHLRGREKELEAQAKQFQKLREDPDALREFLAEQGLEFAEDDEDTDVDPENAWVDDEDPDPTAELRKQVQELSQWQQQQLVNQAQAEFNEHIEQLASQEGVELDDFDRETILARSIQTGFTRDTTEKAFKSLVERNKQREQKALDAWRQSKRAPHVSASGKSATQKIDLTDPNTRAEYIDELLSSRED